MSRCPSLSKNVPGIDNHEDLHFPKHKNLLEMFGCPQIQKPPCRNWRCQSWNIPDAFVVGVHDLKIYTYNQTCYYKKTPDLITFAKVMDLKLSSFNVLLNKINCRVYLNYDNGYHSTHN